MVRPEFGQMVRVSQILTRSGTKSGSGSWVNYWKSISKTVEGLFIGTRTLYDGVLRWTDYDGTYFQPTHHFEGGVLVPSKRGRPIKFPLDAIEKVWWVEHGKEDGHEK